MLRPYYLLACVALLSAISPGCGQQAQTATTGTQQHAALDGSKYILVEEPEGAVGVILAREEAKDLDDIVLVGRIGGRKNPWIEGRSAFTVIDASMTVVADGAESEEGQVCMDDCCAALRADCTTLVKIVDPQGQIVPVDARELLGVKENDMVVVQGQTQRGEDGSFSVVATGVHVRR